MEREIMFRAQRIDSKEWVYGNLIVDTFNGRYFIYDPQNEDHENFNPFRDKYLVIPETVGQLQYSKDKQQYYSGDIVGIWNRVEYGTKELAEEDDAYVVSEIDEYGFVSSPCEDVEGWHVAFIEDASCKVELLGNIHDNPELTIK